MNKLKLPSIKGKFGDWIYFNATMKVKDVANPKRIATVAEIPELYPKNISDVLQREIDPRRISKISEYLRTQKERFISNMIVAIYKGAPEWSEIRIEDSFQIGDEKLSDEDRLYMDGRLGILSLNGDESVFVLDGQHRLKGIRAAYTLDPEKLGNDDVSLTFVVHDSVLRERTRRLFTILNRYAEKPKKAELIIMEEDDAAAILTRRLVLNYSIFQQDNAISKAKDFGMPVSDTKSFTTLVCIYEINKVLINFNKIYPKKGQIHRLSDKLLEEMYVEKLLTFWNFLFEAFPEIEKFINGRASIDVVRNKENGGSLLLRPEAQLLIAESYKHFLDKSAESFKEFKNKIVMVNYNLTHQDWKYVFWLGGKMNIGSKKLKKNVFLYLLGERVDVSLMNRDLSKLYEDYGDVYQKHIKPIHIENSEQPD